MQRSALVLLLLALAGLTGCGLQQAQPAGTPTAPAAVALKSYHDARYGFSFKYPGNWSVSPRGGSTVSVQGVSTYELSIKIPGNKAQLQVTVDQNIQTFPSFPEGESVKDPAGGPDTLHYHHLTVSGWPAMGIERFNGSTLDATYTIVNTRTYSYQVRMVTASPPPTPQQIKGYQTVVRTLKVPFS